MKAELPSSDLSHLASLVRSASDAILSLTSDGRILSWNDGACRLYGWSAEEAVGRPVSILSPAERTAEELELVWTKTAQGKSIKDYETVHVHKTGGRVEVSITISPILDEAGRVVGASCVARDISSRLGAEQSRLADAEAFEAALQELRLFAAVTAHEIARQLETVLAAALSEPARAAAESALQAARDLSCVSSAPRPEVRKARVELRGACDRALARLRPRIDRKGACIELGALPEIAGDADEMAALFEGLVANALEHGRPGRPPQIRILGREQPDRIELTVEDDGDGDFGAPEKIFVPQERTVGLALCQRIARRHGGRVEAFSRPGKGARFTVRLPLR